LGHLRRRRRARWAELPAWRVPAAAAAQHRRDRPPRRQQPRDHRARRDRRRARQPGAVLMAEIREIPLLPVEPPKVTVMRIALDDIDCADVGPPAKDVLVAQIKAFGVLEPIKVIPIPAKDTRYASGKRYEIVDGRRRYNACWRAELTEIPCIVIYVSRDEVEPAMIALSSHRLRSPNHAVELSEIVRMIESGHQ